MRQYRSLANFHSAVRVIHPRSVGGDQSDIDSDNDERMSSASDIQLHLYDAFLNGRTSDVNLHVRGSWEGIYKLHRVVLIQAGFFRSLFDGGFREESGQDEVNVTFDDPNITRAAFEICISRLYGGGPSLHVDPRLIPTRKDPLTPSFPRPLPLTNVPPGEHAATPRFLLSLLATATYLSIPSQVSQAVTLILNSLGPHTVIRYLNFALGKGIGEKSEKDPEYAAGLEKVCQEPRYPISTYATSVRSSVSKRSKRSVIQVFNEPVAAQKEEAPDTDSSLSDDDNHTELVRLAEDDGPVYLYGAASNKIGEVAACWLCRWGADMLAIEELVEPISNDAKQERSTPARRRATESCASGPPSFVGISKENVPYIWRRGGMSADWIRVVLSSDAFFIRDERDRYELACKAVELRRRESIDEDEEKEWNELFATGIHYMHMSLDDLIEISNDISPITGLPIVPVSVIQAAHWNQSVLRHHITYRQNSASPSTPPRSPAPARDGSLGLSQSTADIIKSHKEQPGSPNIHGAYYPVPVDSSSRIGDTTGIEGASTIGTESRSKNAPRHTSSNFFGILSGPQAVPAIQSSNNSNTIWSMFPPIRFGVEFWGVDGLAEKARLTSQTIWYAGSLFNVYVQVIRKNKGIQLGMYLHRLSSVETIPVPSLPPLPMTENAPRLSTIQPVTIPTSSSTPTLHRAISRGTTGTTVSRPTTPASSPGISNSPPSSSPVNSSPLNSYGSNSSFSSPRPPAQPYRDPREAVRAHFTLLCASPTGGALTRFASAPDAFHVGRSWGWKSSALQAEALVDIQNHGDISSAGTSELTNGKTECSLRATVVLGVV